MNFDNKVIFFIGYPGSGKGTQAKILAKEYNIIHLSTGELFCNEVKKNTEIGKQMDYYMSRGEIIPRDLTFDYLKDELDKDYYKHGLIIDGYPKNIESLDFILGLLKKLNYQIINIFHFKISRDEVLERLTNRNDLSRSDDTIEAINNRLDSFEIHTIPVLDKLSKITKETLMNNQFI